MYCSLHLTAGIAIFRFDISSGIPMNFINFLNHILRPLEWVVAQLLTLSHHALVAFGMPAGPSPAWGIAIMCLVLIIRICLLPLFLS